MPIEILMPALSPTMTEGNLTKWHKKEGDTVEPGDVIAEIETDKATMEVEAVDEGVLGKILVADGTEAVPVNQLIALLLEEDEDKKVLDGYTADAAKTQTEESTESKEDEAEVKEEIEQEEASKPKEVEPEPTKTETSKPSSVNHSQSTIAPTTSGRIKASPLAKRLAKEAGIDIAQIVGTGPNGRIVRADVEGAKQGGGAMRPIRQVGRNSVESEAVPLNTMRKTIAKRLLESKTTIPHFYLTVECKIDNILESRAALNELAQSEAGEGKAAYKLTVNDFVIKAVAMALQKVPEANASWVGDAIIQYNNVDVSVAVAIDGGLITPIVKNADQKTLSEISNEVKDLAARAKQGTLAPEEFQGGGFSISNLGMYGIKEFSAIINPPQAAILAVGAGEKRFIPDSSGQPIAATMMNVTLSSDHRVVDGAVGAVFLKYFKHYIEQPLMMFV